VVEPRSVAYHLAYRVGSRHPLGRGAAGLALLALREPSAWEPAAVGQVRERGYAMTYGQVEPGAYGVAVPLRLHDAQAQLCVNLITTREELAHGCVPRLLAVAEETVAAMG
jgi:DNA-binding IclR family transcriptional regulator